MDHYHMTKQEPSMIVGFSEETQNLLPDALHATVCPWASVLSLEESSLKTVCLQSET